MKRLLHITLFLVFGFSAFSQNVKMLNPADFKDHNLDQSWVYVKYAPDKTPINLTANRAGRLSDSKSASSLNLLKVKVPDGMDPIAFCNELRKSSPGLIYADPVVEYIPLSTPSDALLSNQYYLSNIRAFDAWDITNGDDDITIGIIDTGVDIDHEDIVNNLWLNTDDPIDGIDNDENGYVDDYYGYDFADDDTDPSIQNGNHGMVVTGIAGASANNGKGIAGVGFNTKVAALKGFRSSNGLSGGLYEAIIYAAENGFDVVNLSWGRMGTPLQSEQDIINYAVEEHDMVVVAAAGNEGGKVTEQNKWYPASYENVLSVGGSDASDNKSSGSTYNHSVDLIAPGVSMFSTVNGNGYANGGPGTSYASPQVAATAALVKDQYPDLTAIQIMERVRTTADDIYDIGSNASYEGKLGKGRLNVFRAVSESNVKSLRVKDALLTSGHGGNAFFGDTVKVTANLTNYLSAINNPFITISSPNDDFTISNGFFQPGFMNSMDTRQITFDIILNEDLVPETDIDVRFDFSGAGYNDFQYLGVTTSPDYVDFGNDKLSMTISGDGDLGFNEYGPDFEGSGFRYQNDTLLTYTGLMLTTGSTQVSDNIITSYSNQSRNEDFSSRKYYKLYHHPAADHFGYSEFTDINRSVFVEQSNISWENEDYLIIRYRIVNTSASAISDLSVGIFADWDLADANSNYAEYDLTGNYIFTRNNDSDLFAAVQVLGGDSFKYSALDMAALNGNSQDINDVFNDESKHDFFVNQEILTAGGTGVGNDVATINGVTIDQLDPYGEAYVSVIYAIADSQANLESELSDASNRLDEFLLKPRVLETFSTCDGTLITIDPASGTDFEFYEDPLAQDLITTGPSFDPGVISKDTTFYVRNIDNNYTSDIYAVRVKLFNDIADFSMSPDTLYLDNPTTNVVQFIDQSQDAVSWNWNFDEGTTTTIQNPSLSFSETGTYSIALDVENALGCSDTFIQDLVVAIRPSPPNLPDITICPGEMVTFSDPSAEKLKLYTFQNSMSPAKSGASVSIASVGKDTTVYISGIYSSFESVKVRVSIDVMEVAGSIVHTPDTTTENHQILLSASGIATGSTVEWYINGASEGTTESLTIPASTGTVDVSLAITSTDDCVTTLEKEVKISTSPFAAQPDITACADEPVIIQPENGTYFGFYEDSELTTLIKKGTQLTTNSFDKVYVVNLDDGLPGMPIEVNITSQFIDFEIAHTSTLIGQKHQVNLSVETTDDISTYKWYINGSLSETVSNPKFFLNNDLYEIVLELTVASGCSAKDTLILDYTPPLGVYNQSFAIYPNPSEGFLHIKSEKKVDQLKLFSLDGKEILAIDSLDQLIDLTSYPHGLYLIKAWLDEDIFERHILLR